MSKIFCVGDIHGCSATLYKLITEEIRLQKNDKLIFVGDYIDRGPDSKGVIDIILDLYNKNYDVTCLMGNHEEMFIESDTDDEIYEHWLTNCGGKFTLQSLNITTYDELHDTYKYFFKTLLHYKTLNNKYIIVHAGLNFRNIDLFEDKYALLWERNTQINHEVLQNRKIIHGHTPQLLDKTIEQLNLISEHKIINIDNGCVFKEKIGLGILTALELTEMKLHSTENVEQN